MEFPSKSITLKTLKRAWCTKHIIDSTHCNKIAVAFSLIVAVTDAQRLFGLFMHYMYFCEEKKTICDVKCMYENCKFCDELARFFSFVA